MFDGDIFFFFSVFRLFMISMSRNPLTAFGNFSALFVFRSTRFRLDSFATIPFFFTEPTLCSYTNTHIFRLQILFFFNCVLFFLFFHWNGADFFILSDSLRRKGNSKQSKAKSKFFYYYFRINNINSTHKLHW